jgi:hypothetical protein
MEQEPTAVTGISHCGAHEDASDHERGVFIVIDVSAVRTRQLPRTGKVSPQIY